MAKRQTIESALKDLDKTLPKRPVQARASMLYEQGYKDGCNHMEQSKAAGILDLQQQLDAARTEITKLKGFRRAAFELLFGEL